MSVPFVGRRNEREALATVLGRARSDGAPAAALITGEPGTGKSRLLAEVLAGNRATSTIRIVGFEPNARVPLAAIGEVLRRLSEVPQHGPRLEALAFGGHDRQSREPLRIFEAAHRALSSFGALLLAVDDLQWVDDQSLGLIHYLLRAAEPARQPLRVIGAARPSTAASSFRDSVEGALAAERRVAIELGPMPLEDGLALAQSIDPGLTDPVAAELWRRARGSPFWVEALARSRGEVDPSAFIGERFRALGNAAGELLAMLATGARPFLVGEVAELLDWDIERVRHSARELVARGLAVELSGTISLAHDLIREAAAQGLPVAARRRLHIRLSQWIETTAGDELSLLREALHHRVAAGLAADTVALQMLQSPQRRLLGGQDLRLLASISDTLQPAIRARLDLDRALGELAATLGEQELALERWTLVSEATSDALERQHAEIEAARAAYMRRQGDEAHAHLNRARDSAPLSDETAVRLDALQAEVELWLDHETAVGRLTADRAYEAACAMAAAAGGLDKLPSGAGRDYVAALGVVIDAAMQEDRLDDVIPLTEEGLVAAQQLDEESYLEALMRVGFALQPTRRLSEREARFRQAWNLAERLVMPAAMIEAGHGLTRSLRDMGRLAEAHDIAGRTVQIEARLREAPRRWGNALSIVHSIELSVGDPSAALEALRDDAKAEADPHYRISIHQTIAQWQARYGGVRHADEVDAELVAARAASEMARCPRCAAELSIVSAEILARIGRVDDAKAELARWEEHATPGGIGLRDLWHRRAGAAIAVADGNDRAAASILEALVAELEDTGLLVELLWARLEIGRLLASTDRVKSIEAFTQAAVLADAIGARSQGRLAAQGLRSLGVRTWRRRRSRGGEGLGALTERELEVARLVADGNSNREIAESLVVSPKTVERHITNVLAKLGLRNRTELASLMRAPGTGFTR